eukprot:GGOE01042930.1.p1 GENE.GGOE01042930.1~~GGOE01042930.1.p1  ORF type:complete len:371 (-),score=53.45 GGOE01042930.1:106-1218(-)
MLMGSQTPSCSCRWLAACLVIICLGTSGWFLRQFGTHQHSDPAQCHSYEEWKPKRQARVLLDALQHHNCSLELLLERTQALSNPRVMKVVHFRNAGLGSQFHCGFNLALIAAASRGRRLVFSDEPWNYGCAGHPRLRDVFQREPEDMSVVGCVLEIDLSLPHTGCMAPYPKKAMRCGRHRIDTFRMQSLAAQHFWRAGITPALGRGVEEKVVQLRALLPPRYTAVHIRSGDKVYLEDHALRNMTEDHRWWAHWISKVSPARQPVFLSSDNCTMANLTQTLLHQLRVPAISRCSAGLLLPGEGHGHVEREWNDGRTCGQIQGFFVDAQLFLSAQLLLGSLKSNVMRFVVELRGSLENMVPVPGSRWHPDAG